MKISYETASTLTYTKRFTKGIEKGFDEVKNLVFYNMLSLELTLG